MQDTPKAMRKIGIIGFGNMGSAIAERIKSKFKVFIFDKDKAKTSNVSGVEVAQDCIDLLTTVNTIVLAVKPQYFDTLLNEIKDYVKDKLIISIAAGITTACIEGRLNRVRVVRVMPNLPAKVGKGMICICKGESATREDLNFTWQLFRNLGEFLVLNENMMDAATAISGSGPGYLYDWGEGRNIEEIKKYTKDVFIPSLTLAASAIGFTLEQAKLLARATGEGSIIFLSNSGLLPQEIKKQVASKGGTTEAGLEVLHRGGSLEEAVKAALKRAKELSRKE